MEQAYLLSSEKVNLAPNPTDDLVVYFEKKQSIQEY
jgi:hypothetical protein